DARGCAEMVREFGRRDIGTRLQSVANPLMQAGPAASAELIGDHPPREGGRELPPFLLVVNLRDEARPCRLLEEIDERGVLDRGRRPQDGRVEPLTDHRRDREGLGAFRREASEPPPDYIAYGFGDLRWLPRQDSVPAERAEL